VLRGEGDGAVEIPAGVAVVPELDVEGGQVDQGPAGVVLQPGGDATSKACSSSTRPPWSPLSSRAVPMLVRAWLSVSWSPSRRASSIARDPHAIAASVR
jgi:hypothetical protein